MCREQVITRCASISHRKQNSRLGENKPEPGVIGTKHTFHHHAYLSSFTRYLPQAMEGAILRFYCVYVTVPPCSLGSLWLVLHRVLPCSATLRLCRNLYSNKSVLTFSQRSKFSGVTFHASSSLVCQHLSAARITETSTSKSVFLSYRSQKGCTFVFLKFRMTFR